MAEELQSDLSLMALEDELTCSICLSPFESPVTIPCGHNFCRDCLLATWKETYSCPQCRSHFPTKPELKKNTVLSTVVETFNLRSGRSEVSLVGQETAAEHNKPIRCDTCMEAEAVQTCLTCMASFCEQHLRPHRENPTFRLHQLSDPVGDLSERICPEHHKLMELFCSQHGRPICSFCLQHVHKGCSFTSPSLRESELKDKLVVLDGKIEKTEGAVFQMSHIGGQLLDGAAKQKATLLAMYRQMQDILAQEEREAQYEVDRELEAGQTTLQELLKKLNDNVTQMRKAKEDIDCLLSQSQTSDFLQASFDLPRAVKFEPNLPKISLDSKTVKANQAFAVALKKHLAKTLQEPVETRLQIIKPNRECAAVTRQVEQVHLQIVGWQTDSCSHVEEHENESQIAPDGKVVTLLPLICETALDQGPAGTENPASQPESVPPPPQRPKQRRPPRSHSPGRRPIQPFLHPVPVPLFSYMGPRPGWNSSQYTHSTAPYFTAPFFSPQPITWQNQKKPGAQDASKQGQTRYSFPKKDDTKSHPGSSKPTTNHPQPNNNN